MLISNLIISYLACCNNVSLRKKFHQGIWNGKRWSCCRLNARSSSGCKDCSAWLNYLAEEKENNKENQKKSKSYILLLLFNILYELTIRYYILYVG